MYTTNKKCMTSNYRVRAKQKKKDFACFTATLRTFLSDIKTSHVFSTPLEILYLAYTFWNTLILKMIKFTYIKYLESVLRSRTLHTGYYWNHIAFFVMEHLPFSKCGIASRGIKQNNSSISSIWDIGILPSTNMKWKQINWTILSVIFYEFGVETLKNLNKYIYYWYYSFNMASFLPIIINWQAVETLKMSPKKDETKILRSAGQNSHYVYFLHLLDISVTCL